MEIVKSKGVRGHGRISNQMLAWKIRFQTFLIFFTILFSFRPLPWIFIYNRVFGEKLQK